ncbi:MAG: dTDP-4-dehydrorhamnose 3,5-epimerase family protein, partial [bacterium]
MEFIPLELKDAWEIRPRVFSDHRGSFITVYSEEEFRKRGLTKHWIAENQSHNLFAGTLRGFHFQAPPAAQTKLVRVASGRAWDVIVDLRLHSPTY